MSEMEKSAFDVRLAERYDELKWLCCELYHNDMDAFRYFCGRLRRCWEERKGALRDLDETRLKQPDWYRSNQLMGMMLYPSAFAGTLKGVGKRLDYLEECGVNYLRLMPLLDSPEGKRDGWSHWQRWRGGSASG